LRPGQDRGEASKRRGKAEAALLLPLDPHIGSRSTWVSAPPVNKILDPPLVVLVFCEIVTDGAGFRWVTVRLLHMTDGVK